jgi:hypothetical protein
VRLFGVWMWTGNRLLNKRIMNIYENLCGLCLYILSSKWARIKNVKRIFPSFRERKQFRAGYQRQM